MRQCSDFIQMIWLATRRGELVPFVGVHSRLLTQGCPEYYPDLRVRPEHCQWREAIHSILHPKVTLDWRESLTWPLAEIDNMEVASEQIALCIERYGLPELLPLDSDKALFEHGGHKGWGMASDFSIPSRPSCPVPRHPLHNRR